MHYQQRQLLTLGGKVHTLSLRAMLSAACKNSSQENPKISAEKTQIVKGTDSEIVYKNVSCVSANVKAAECFLSCCRWKNYGRGLGVREALEKHGCTLSSGRFERRKRAKEIPRVSRECTNRAQKVHDILRDGLISFYTGWETSSDALAAEHNRFRTGASPHQRGKEQYTLSGYRPMDNCLTDRRKMSLL